MNVNKGYYLQRDLRSPDCQYKKLLNEILSKGHEKDTIQEVKAVTLLAPTPLRFRLKNGIPLITERNLAIKPKGKPFLWQQSVAEIIAYINGAHTVEEMESFGCYWWKEWGSEAKCKRFGLPPGEFGLGFYGNAFKRFPQLNGDGFNQIEEVLKQIKTNPLSRTHFISPWIPQYLIGEHRKTTITPCLGWIYFEVRDDKISMVLTQRAGDVPIGIPFNTFQYAVLLLMVAQVSNLIPHEFVHLIIDAHIYSNQLPSVNTMLEREDRIFPSVKINPKIQNLFDFRFDDFVIEGYSPHPPIKDIPVNDV